MRRTIAAVVLVTGMTAVVLASSSAFHLRQLAFRSGPVDFDQHFDFRIMTAGMQGDSNTGVAMAADLARQLQTRVNVVFGLGLMLVLTGAAGLLIPRRSQHGQPVGPHAPGRAAPIE